MQFLCDSGDFYYSLMSSLCRFPLTGLRHVTPAALQLALFISFLLQQFHSLSAVLEIQIAYLYFIVRFCIARGCLFCIFVITRFSFKAGACRMI